MKHLVGLQAWVPIGTTVRYCPIHDEISFGYFQAHYCEHAIDLGYLSETYEEQLERELRSAQYRIQELLEERQTYVAHKK